MNEERLAGLQVRAKNQRRIAGRIDDRNRGAFLERHPVGQQVGVAGGDNRSLRETAGLRSGENAISNRESLDSLTDLSHHARYFPTRRKGESGFGLVFALDDQDVEEIATGRAHLDLECARSGFGLGNLRNPEFRGFHPVVDCDCTHETSPPRPARVPSISVPERPF